MWGRITVAPGPGWVDCPLCRTRLYTAGRPVRLPHHLTEGGETCSGSHRTWAAAEELAALRLRAHP